MGASFSCCYKRKVVSLKHKSRGTISSSKKRIVERRNSGLGITPQRGFATLSAAIEAWELAMRLQHDLEYAFIHRDRGHPEAIKKLHQDPDSYSDSLIQGVSFMSSNLIHIRNCENEISRLEEETVKYHDNYHRDSSFAAPVRDADGTVPVSSSSSSSNSQDGIEINPIHAGAAGEKKTPGGSVFGFGKGKKEEPKLVPSLSVKLQTLYVKRLNESISVTPRLRELQVFAELGDAVGSAHHNVDAREASAWPEWLTDVSYELTKVSRYLQKQPRKLLLTEYHCITLKDQQEIRRAIKYLDIVDIKLSGTGAFSISTESTTFKYESTNSVHIVHQLKSRVNARNALEKSGFYYSGLTSDRLRGYNLEEGNEIMKSIRSKIPTTVVKSSNSRDIMQFAEALYDRTPMRKKIRESSSCPRDASVASISSVASIHTIVERKWTDERIAGLFEIKPGSPENMVSEAIVKIINDSDEPEGYTREKFVDSFYKNPNLDRLREFIATLYEHIVKSRWDHLMAVMLGSDATAIRGSTGVSWDVDESAATEVSSPMAVTGDTLHFDYEDEKLEEYGPSLAFSIYSHVEESLYGSLEAILFPPVVLGKDFESLKEKISRFKVSRSSQESWEISPKFVSRDGWRLAAIALAGIEGNFTPTRRMHALTRCMNLIMTEFNSNQLDMTENVRVFLGADDLLPIFIYVLVHCDLDNPAVLPDLLWKLCHPDQVQGESGYYLTILESAISYLEDLK